MSTDIEIASTNDAELSRLRQARAERERLERVLLMLPGALIGGSGAETVELFGAAACELTGARIGIVSFPERFETSIHGVDGPLMSSPIELEDFPWLAPAFDGEVVHVLDTRRLHSHGRRIQFGSTSDGRELRSVLALPIRGRGTDTHGVMCLAHHRSRAFSDRQVGLARAVAAYLGHAIEVTESAAEDRRIASALLETLLPPLLPEISGVEICARYRPSGRGNLVGGDFYDIFPNGHGGWSLLVGDSSGIGPEAAGLAGIARYTARALAESSLAPAEMLGHLNRALLRAAPDDRFCTAVLLGFELDGDHLVVKLASAGHPSVYRIAVDGSVSVASESTGTILGVIEDAPVGQAGLDLLPGEALVLYTDGVTEARNAAGEQFGDERLVRVLEEAVGRSAEGIARRVELAVTDHRGPRNSDDVAIVVLRVASSELQSARR